MDVSNQKWKRIIILLSVVVPLLVALLYVLPKEGAAASWVYSLPLLNALINGTTTIVLILAFIAIKNQNRITHQRLMTFALVLSVFFLLSYVTYHSLTDHTSYGGEGMMRTIYFIILISHILLAIVIVPLVLITFSRALSQKFDKHKKIARICLPLWLYVTITGVIVYIMISPYY